jgi:hypothetical protein
MVAKIYWPHERRLNEEDIIHRAGQIPDAREHLPGVFGSCDGYRTSRIRTELGIPQTAIHAPRVLRVLFLERLRPITELQGQNFIKAWLQCVRSKPGFILLLISVRFPSTTTGHYQLWQNGVCHRDLSPPNLMFREVHGQNFGVLNDWDLSVINEESPDVGEHIATIPFLAADLLDDSIWLRKVQVRYRHDLESFVWILFWVLCCYKDGAEEAPETFRRWKTTDTVSCWGARLNTVTRFDAVVVQSGWETEWPILTSLAPWLVRKHFPLNAPEPSDHQVLTELSQHLDGVSTSPGLEYLRDQLCL